MTPVDNNFVNVLIRGLAVVAVFSLVLMTPDLHGQERDLRAERLILDDTGTDSTFNTVTIRTPSTLTQNVVLTIPDPGTTTAEFMLASGNGEYWLPGGNIGTISDTNFLGTTDSTAIQLQVRGESGTIANSLILNENGSLQRDTGGNARGASAVDLQFAHSGATEVAMGNYSVIAGGMNNGVENTNGTHSTIRGGSGNTLRSNQNPYAVIGGGLSGEIGSSQYAIIGGGSNNSIDTSSQYASILGGRSNLTGLSNGAFIGGGRSNTVNPYSFLGMIGGGESNTIGSASGPVIVGGGDNRVYDANYGVIGGGYRNLMHDIASRATIGGGSGNIVDVRCDFATIRGGAFIWVRRMDNPALQLDSYATVGGGRGHTIGQGSGLSYATGVTVGGGRGHTTGTNSQYSTIGGGMSLDIDKAYSVIPGGRELDLKGIGSFGFLANGGSNDMTISEPEVVVFGNTNLWLVNNNNRPSQLRFYEPYDTSGAFPGSAYYTSFEAPALADTIKYILPASKPNSTDSVLAVSAINGDTITLAWINGNDAVGTHRLDDVPTTIALPNDNSRLKTRMVELEAQYETQERLFEAQEKELKALLIKVQALQGQETNR
ncbi:MAG: hypothetical protein KDD67_07130 [Ignavibacteriae bacterium]|nr:hypothetical protein [Ignavibacteriota bacterium]MCB9215250.1 hypothetical protein [Ignavibacteria bacterium]